MAERRRASDQSFLLRLRTTLREQPILVPLLVVIGLQLLMLLFSLLVLSPRASDNQEGIEAISTQNSILIRENAKAGLMQCRRGNVSRPETIQDRLSDAANLRADAADLRADARFYDSVAAENPSSVTAAKLNLAAAKKRGRARDKITAAGAKVDGAKSIVSAQREVAKHPHAESLVKQSLVDCEGQFG